MTIDSSLLHITVISNICAISEINHIILIAVVLKNKR